MGTGLHHHLSIAYKAAIFAFFRSYRNGDSLGNILGYYDALTKIPNRKAFEEDRHTMHVFDTFILIDVDHLKQINDTFGHLFGDEILCSCARILAKATEKIGKAYRIAGDEFALIIPKCWVKTVCLFIKNRIKEDSRFSISMGISPVSGSPVLTDELFRAAETELYRSKHSEPDTDSAFLTDDNRQRVAPGDLYIEDSCIRGPLAIAAVS